MNRDYQVIIRKRAEAQIASAYDWYRDFRRVPVRRFPYGVFYRVDGRRVIIQRVLHNRQNLTNLE